MSFNHVGFDAQFTEGGFFFFKITNLQKIDFVVA